LTFTVNATDADGRVVALRVDWGDGTPTTVLGEVAGGRATATHVYDDEGGYAVTVTATDDDGAVATATSTAEVSEGGGGGDGGGGLGWLPLAVVAVVVAILVLALLIRRPGKRRETESVSRPLGPPRVGE
jgi:hypothetical protein